MKIIKIDTNNLINGPGNRCVVWISGCSHNCPGCHNPETHDHNLGDDFGQEHWEIIEKQLRDPLIDGVTFTGGDPLDPRNISDLAILVKRIKTEYPAKSIWIWTGYNYEDVKDLDFMKYVDVLVDGLFIQDLHPVRKVLRYRGSVNQRVIDVQKSSDSIVYWTDFDGWNSSQDHYKGQHN